jgi:hypothetical protein
MKAPSQPILPLLGLIGFDRMRQPPSLAMKTPHRRLLRRVSFFKVGGASGNQGRSAFSKNDPQLPEIIMEINDLRRVARVSDRPEQDRRRFYHRAFRR